MPVEQSTNSVPNRTATYDEFEVTWGDPISLIKDLDAIKDIIIFGEPVLLLPY